MSDEQKTKKRPLIGITSSYEHNSDVKDAYKSSVSMDYSLAILQSGGIPIVLPCHEDIDAIEQLIEKLDGLLLSGGVDPDPMLYGEDCLQNIGEISPERDKFEYILLEKFIKTKKPILGICRGLQLVNIFYGGTLYQDISYVNTIIQHKQKWFLDMPTHDIEIIENDHLFYTLFGKNTRVNSFHHQMIKDLSPKLTAIACSKDGVIEGVMKKDHPFFYATQWHPEMMSTRGNAEMKKLFDAFIEKCQ